MQKNDGFTLVELIVVIAILAVLAGVALPVYSGYVRRAKDAQVLVSLDAVVTAAQTANYKGDSITTIKISADGMKIEIMTDDSEEGIDFEFIKNFSELYGCAYENNSLGTISSSNAMIDLSGSSFENGAVWYAHDGEGQVSGWHPLK